MFFTGLGFLQASGMAFSENMSLKNGFPNQNPLDKKDHLLCDISHLPFFFFILVLILGILFVCLRQDLTVAGLECTV